MARRPPPTRRQLLDRRRDAGQLRRDRERPNYNTYTTPANSPIVLANGGTTTRNFTLSQTAGTLSGTVTRGRRRAAGRRDGDRVDGASVQTTAGGAIHRVGEAGNVHGDRDRGHHTTPRARSASRCSNNGTATQNFTLTPLPGSLKGVVTNPARRRSPGATVVLSNGGGSAVTDATGSYAIASLTPGTYTATVSATTYNTLTTAGIVIANGAATTQNFTLTPLPGTLAGRRHQQRRHRRAVDDRAALERLRRRRRMRAAATPSRR